MSDDEGSRTNLRRFRIQKNTSHNQANGSSSNEETNITSDGSSDNPKKVKLPGRRRIVRVSDSDSDPDDPSYKNGTDDDEVIILPPKEKVIISVSDSPPPVNKKESIAISASNLISQSSFRPIKTPKVVERESKVKYLIKTFPKTESFEIYNLLSKVGFNIEEACDSLLKSKNRPSDFVSFEAWARENNLEDVICAKPDSSDSKATTTTKKESSPVTTEKIEPAVSSTLKREREEKVTPPIVKPRPKRRRTEHHDDDSNDSTKDHYKDSRVYDSDQDSDVEISDELTGDKKKVLEFLQTATVAELSLMSSCSKRKVDILLAARPFAGWIDLVQKLQDTRGLNTDLLNHAQRVLQTRNNVKALMRKCTSIATQLEFAIKSEGTIKEQPSIMPSHLKLTGYQIVGLNWLAVLHQQGVNGILADEMGLGKTVQVIAFLAHLKQIKAAKTTHLVVVPASTLENWQNEFFRWCPEIRVMLYYGSTEERKSFRVMISQGKHRDFDVILTTYTMVGSSPEEKKMFRVTPMHYVIFDEAHMLKNMNTQRYETLFKIKALKRILLTGTPLQNNLLELMSLLTFVMPNIFAEKTDDLKTLFRNKGKKEKENDDLPAFEKDQIEQAKRIMKPFVLRRLKKDVLQDLPKKIDEKLEIDMVPSQLEQYKGLVVSFQESQKRGDAGYSGMSMMTDLRKLSNHPLLMRYYYTYEDLPEIAKRLAADTKYKDTVEKYIIDDLACMSDFEIHTMSQEYLCLKNFALPKELICVSGKFSYLDEKLADLKQNGHRVLIFSQYVIMLNIMEEYIKIRNHSYLRLDGSTPVTIRQDLIDEYTEDSTIFIFLLSTKAGGLGINLTAADTVIIHDIDFNPYNDKQAEDRCHRMGQSKTVSVFRLISKGTIEEGMWDLAQDKLKLEQEITTDDYENTDIKSVVTLLSSALGIDTENATTLVAPAKVS